MVLNAAVSRVKTITDSKVEFGLIPRDHWNQPDWIDEERATKAREDMVKNNVIYGGSCSVALLRSLLVPAHLFTGSVP